MKIEYHNNYITLKHMDKEFIISVDDDFSHNEYLRFINNDTFWMCYDITGTFLVSILTYYMKSDMMANTINVDRKTLQEIDEFVENGLLKSIKHKIERIYETN